MSDVVYLLADLLEVEVFCGFDEHDAEAGLGGSCRAAAAMDIALKERTMHV